MLTMYMVVAPQCNAQRLVHVCGSCSSVQRTATARVPCSCLKFRHLQRALLEFVLRLTHIFLIIRLTVLRGPPFLPLRWLSSFSHCSIRLVWNLYCGIGRLLGCGGRHVWYLTICSLMYGLGDLEALATTTLLFLLQLGSLHR